MTKTTKPKGNAGGRPHSYDPNLVHEIIAAGLAAGIPMADLDATFVRGKLCGEHGVKGSIRQEALEALVDATHADIAEAQNEALLNALPAGIADEVNAASAAAGRDMLLVVARQSAASQSIADQRCEELRADKRNAQHRIAILEGDLADEKAARDALTRERDKVLGHLVEAEEKLRSALAEVERLGREPSGIDRLLEKLRDPAIRDDVRGMLIDIIGNFSPPPAK